MWPYYDKAAGQAIRETVEPILEQYKPPGLIKRIYFKTLTFGDAPIRIDNVWVEDEGEEHVTMEARRRPRARRRAQARALAGWGCWAPARRSARSVPAACFHLHAWHASMQRTRRAARLAPVGRLRTADPQDRVRVMAGLGRCQARGAGCRAQTAGAAAQVAFRWAGDANIALAIELPAGGEATRMVPKVSDLQVAGVARVTLTPLVPEIPGFGAAVISLRCASLARGGAPRPARPALAGIHVRLRAETQRRAEHIC
jgi:hypothetical protein